MDKCNFCGAEKVYNPKTSKWFCKDKCWLKKSDKPTPQQPHPDMYEVLEEIARNVREIKNHLMGE